MALDGVGLAATEILAPSPPAPNGPVMSSVTSTCFWVERRDSRAGFNRVRISLSGSITGLWSCSPPELTNTPGAAFRNSPKAIFTEPNASCVRIFSSGTAIIVPAGGACMTFARKSIGSAARIDCRGRCNSSGFSSGAGGSWWVPGMPAAPFAGARRQPGRQVTGGAATAQRARCFPGCGCCLHRRGGAADLGATRRILFSHCLTWNSCFTDGRSTDRLVLFQQEARHGWFFVRVSRPNL